MALDIHTFNARDFRSNPIYRHQAPFEGIQTELKQIVDFYGRIERQHNYFTVALIICIAVPVVLVFTLHSLGELGWLLIFGFLVAGVYAGTMRNRARQWHFPRDRDRLFSDVLRLVKRDMDPQEPMDIQLCLGQTTQTGKAIRQQPDPLNPSHQLEHWRNPWFGIKGRFLDNSIFSLRLVECSTRPAASQKQTTTAEQTVSQRDKHSKKNQSTCEGFELNLQLHVDQQQYGDLTPLAPHLNGAVKLLPGAELIHHYSEAQDLSLTLSLPPAFTASLMYQSTAMLFLSAYHILHLAAQLHHPNNHPSHHPDHVTPGAIPEIASVQNNGFKPELKPSNSNPQSQGGLSQ